MLDRILRAIKYRVLKYCGSAKCFASFLYELTCGKKMNWKHPEDLNQWINWLAFNTDTTKWSELADKYKVRDFVAQKGFGDFLVPIIKVWSSPDEISLLDLPEKFVMKINNGSGDVRMVKNKEEVNEEELKNYFRGLYKRRFGKATAEPHYMKITPHIIVEQLLDNSKQQVKSNSLIDYKFWCFNGKPFICFVITNRTKQSITIETYSADNEWRCNSEEMIVYNEHHLRGSGKFPKPESLGQMLNAASILSKGFPEVRIDFYEIDGKPYFGEMTFTSQAGRMDYFTQYALDVMGQKCKAAVEDLGIIKK